MMNVWIVNPYDNLPSEGNRAQRYWLMAEASVMMVGQNKDRILEGLAHLDALPSESLRFPVTAGDNRNATRPVADYSMPNVSEKVVRIIISYADYIKRRVWNEA